MWTQEDKDQFAKNAIFSRKGKAIRTVSAVCGSGKSSSLIMNIIEKQMDRNYLIVLPTIALANQFYDNFTKSGISNIKMINNQTSPGKVQEEITTLTKNCLDASHILIVTLCAYDDLRCFINIEDWDVYIDEIPQVDKSINYNISENKEFITDLLELGEKINSEIAKVIVKPGFEAKLRNASRSLDSCDAVFEKLYCAVLSPNKDVFVSIDEWKNVALSQTFNHGDIHFQSMLNANQFINTTILGAHFEHSLFYKWLTKYHNAKFEEDLKITEGLRFQEHKNLSERVELHYFFEDRNYSKYLRNQVLDCDSTVGAEMDKIAVDFFDREEFLYVVNKDHNSELLGKHKLAKKLPVKAHGMNKYKDQTNIYFSASLNHKPQNRKILVALGLTDNEIRIANTFETIYQCLMRTALRDINSDKKVKILLPDETSASFICDLLGGGSIQWLKNNILPSKFPALSTSDRNRVSKFNKITIHLLSNRVDKSAVNIDELESEKEHKTLHFPLYVKG